MVKRVYSVFFQVDYSVLLEDLFLKKENKHTKVSFCLLMFFLIK